MASAKRASVEPFHHRGIGAFLGRANLGGAAFPEEGIVYVAGDLYFGVAEGNHACGAVDACNASRRGPAPREDVAGFIEKPVSQGRQQAHPAVVRGAAADPDENLAAAVSQCVGYHLPGSVSRGALGVPFFGQQQRQSCGGRQFDDGGFAVVDNSVAGIQRPHQRVVYTHRAELPAHA